MRREQRLRHRKDFAAAYRQGRTQGNQFLVVRVRPNGTGVTRFGFVAGKIVGGAVVRNRVKRQLREAARSIPTAAGLDIVIGARKSSAAVDYRKLRQALAALIKRADAAPPGAGPSNGQEQA
ncbi:MAG: ribonuclease P protein component [Dehalococcoidia bacterium]|nr:MAG: ribonuclease P protein component [Dehalococcoidia bacterium]